jgi:hypothetical protein
MEGHGTLLRVLEHHCGTWRAIYSKGKHGGPWRAMEDLLRLWNTIEAIEAIEHH